MKTGPLKWWVSSVTLTIFLILIVFKLVTGTIGVLGPSDKPDFAAEPWDALDITYWIFTAQDNRPIKRILTVETPYAIAELKSQFIATDISGLSIGTDRQLIFRQGEKVIWQGSPVFEDTFYFSLTNESGRYYKFTLKDTGFYDELLQLCVTNERVFNPEAETKHIKLRSNLATHYPRLPNP